MASLMYFLPSDALPGNAAKSAPLLHSVLDAARSVNVTSVAEALTPAPSDSRHDAMSPAPFFIILCSRCAPP